MSILNISTKNGGLHISGLTDSCPFCFKSITPEIIYGYIRKPNFLSVFLCCPDKDCRETFNAEYEKSSGSSTYYFQGKVTKGNFKTTNFNPIINEISQEFVKIYNQSYFAEQNNLLEICGVGYRKSLEFLIKDYCKIKYPENVEEIEKKALAKCISDYINDERIKKVAKRATWLGNDQTHYIKKWEGKNLNDLKLLIQLTLHWIEMEKLSENFELEMPD